MLDGPGTQAQPEQLSPAYHSVLAGRETVDTPFEVQWAASTLHIKAKVAHCEFRPPGAAGDRAQPAESAASR